MAIIETDHYNPIQIINLTTFQVINTIPVNDVILEAYFLDSTNTIVVVFCLNSFVVANLTSNKQYILPPISATSYAGDLDGSLFTCHNDVLHQISLTFTETFDESQFYEKLKESGDE